MGDGKIDHLLEVMLMWPIHAWKPITQMGDDINTGQIRQFQSVSDEIAKVELLQNVWILCAK